MNAPRPRLIAASLALALLAACSGQPSAPAPENTADATVAPAQAPAPAVAADDEAGLRRAAAAALSEQRIYAPAGDNAIEHYLAMRRLQPDDASLATALLELLPYALIGSEQAVGRGDFPEARRLLALIELSDAQSPALPRLRDSITSAEAAAAERVIAEAEAAKLREQQLAQAQADADAAAQTRQVAAAAAPAVAAPAPVVAAPVPAPPPVVAATRPAAPAAPPAATPALPRLLSAPAPRYPVMAMRRKLEGDVTVEFTILADGSVSAPRVVSADPPGQFEEAALVAARRWRFETGPGSVTTRRVVQFRLASAAQ